MYCKCFCRVFSRIFCENFGNIMYIPRIAAISQRISRANCLSSNRLDFICEATLTIKVEAWWFNSSSGININIFIIGTYLGRKNIIVIGINRKRKLYLQCQIASLSFFHSVFEKCVSSRGFFSQKIFQNLFNFGHRCCVSKMKIIQNRGQNFDSRKIKI